MQRNKLRVSELMLAFFLPIFAFGQSADWREIQGKIDEAIKTGGTVQLSPNRVYTIDKPLIAAEWNGTEYRQVYFRMEGNGSMWDNGKSTSIVATFKDAPIFSIQKGKGCVIRGITFKGAYRAPEGLPHGKPFETYGDPTCRDSRYSPYAAVCIDPFSGELPPDGGYPSLKSWYRGPQSRAGSTGLRFEDCTFTNTTIGFITSPNGYTQNAEIITLQNIRIGECKAGIVGCQAQEKMNRVLNIGAWEKCHTLFVWNTYGAGQPGNWIVDGVNIAGSVGNILYRISHGWFPLYMSNVYAEQVASVGVWQSLVGDQLKNASINLYLPDQQFGLADFALSGGGGVEVVATSIRYYGYEDWSILVPGEYKGINEPQFSTGRGLNSLKNFNMFLEQQLTVKDGKVAVKGTCAELKPGMLVTFFHNANWEYRGQGVVSEVNKDFFYVKYLSPAILKGGRFGVGIKKRS